MAWNLILSTVCVYTVFCFFLYHALCPRFCWGSCALEISIIINSCCQLEFQPIRSREIPTTREFLEGRMGSRFSFSKRACVEVFHDCKQHGKKCAWVFCKSDLRYPKRQAGGVSSFCFCFPQTSSQQGKML